MSDRVERPLIPHVRVVLLLCAAGVVGWWLYGIQYGGAAANWWLLAAGVALAMAGHIGLRYPAPEPAPPPPPAGWVRLLTGMALAVAGAAVWGLGSYRLTMAWIENFDLAWICWSTGIVLIGVGLDFAWGAFWPGQLLRPPRTRRWAIALLVIVVAAGLYRLGNIADFPGEAAITQIEDLQVGNFGLAYLEGYRLRWEYLSSTWLAALALWLGNPTQATLRIPFAAVSALKVLPLFLWLRNAVGTTGAVVGSLLMVWSFWDVVLSRIPNNHNALVVSIVFALLAGPVRRGRPSAYAWLGFFSGYILHEYVAYRPLAAFALLGAVLCSLRDGSASWRLRIARPLLTTVLLATMVTPLFGNRLAHSFRLEYLDGWNRARGNTAYFDPQQKWTTTVEQRIERARAAFGLFVVHGDASPVRGVSGQPPLIDPVTAALVALGIGGVLAHCLQPVLALTLAGLLVTVAGTLIMTGNFDVARVGGAVPYVYALAGYGGAGLAAALSQAWRWRRAGIAAAAVLLAAALGFAAYWNTAHLFELWTSPEVRRAHRNNLAYLTVWMRHNVRPGERVVGIAPNHTNVLAGHDGSWLRGGPVHGLVAIDVDTALRQWMNEPGPTLLFVFDSHNTPALVAYLEQLLPGVTFTVDPDPLQLDGQVAYVRLPGPPAELAERLAAADCRGARAEFSLLGAKNETVYREVKVVPYIGKSVWPTTLLDKLHSLNPRPLGIRIQARSSFQVTHPGRYSFDTETSAGSAQISIDGQPIKTTPSMVELGSGTHVLELTANFAPMWPEPSIRLMWRGPDTGGRDELMPFYRIAPVDPRCGLGTTAVASAGAGEERAKAPGRRRYLTDWLGLGPFVDIDPKKDPGDALAVAPKRLQGIRLSMPGPAAGAPVSAPPGALSWRNVVAQGQFVDLAATFDRDSAAASAPTRRCAYAATSVRAAAAGAAYLELSASGDQMRVWLNGRRLTPGWLTVAYAPLRRLVELRSGENLLVVESCGAGRSWFFTARLANAERGDLAGLKARAALQTQPLAAGAAEPALEAQMVEGFAELVSAPHEHATYPDHRGGGPGWWAQMEDGDRQVVWRSAPVPERRRTILALTAATSRDAGEAELLVDGRPVLRFPFGPAAIGTMWEADGYQMAFVYRAGEEWRSGVLLIAVPPDAVTPGQPLELRVRLTGGERLGWFMVKGYRDTISREELTGVVAPELLPDRWTAVPQPPADTS